MDEETRELINKIYDLTHENNKMLHKMHRVAIYGRITQTLYWIVILALSVSAYYYIQPYLDSVLKGYQSILENAGKVGSAAQKIENIGSALQK